MVGATKVASFLHKDSSAAPQTMALFLQPDTLLLTYLYVCGPYTDDGLSYREHC